MMLTAEQFRRLEDLFHGLAELGLPEQAERLREIKVSDPGLYPELLRMLGETRADQREQLDALMDLAGQFDEPGSGLPDTIGPYRLIGLLGQGGMGRVYEAEQTEPVKRRVALKVARGGLLSESARARFLVERQTLALLDHPNIAKIFDAGRTESGRLWFVMELVHGCPITQWADEHQLRLRQRIELFLPICHAVHHAHQKGIIHRDLKPSNLLVVDDGEFGQPRVIDFGVAKIMAETEEAQAFATRVGDAVGTPEYMSPEQAALGEVDIDTRSDVYALGLVLHELLVGRLPIDPETLRSASFGEICRRIREDPVTAPSRLAIQAQGSARSARLKGDLDLVLLKALAKDRSERYGSAAALAEDLQRHLKNLPVQAAPPVWRYRAAKFIRRHRLPVALASVAGIGLVLLTAVALWQAQIAASERDRAQAEATRSATVLAFFQDMLASADPARAQGRDLSVRELLDQTYSSLPEADLDSLARAAVEETLATTYNALGLSDQGLPLAQAATERLRAELGTDHPMTLSAQHAEARFYLYLGRYDEAIDLLESTLADRERVLGLHMDTIGSLHNLAYAYAERGDIEHALMLDERQLEMVEQLKGVGSEEALVTMSSIAHAYFMLDRYEEATGMFEEILAGHRRFRGDRHPVTLSVLHNLAYLTKQAGDFETAEARYLELIDARREVLGSHHVQTLNTIANLGAMYVEQERLSEAAPLMAEALGGREAALGPEHPETLSTRLAMLKLQAALGRIEGLAEELDQLYDLAMNVTGTDSQLSRGTAELMAQLQTASNLIEAQ